MPVFNVSLKDCPNATAPMIEQAEERFVQVLESCFTDSATMLALYKIWQDATEGGSGLTLSKADVTKAQQFQRAYEKARLAAFQKIKPSEDTFFELRLA